MNFNNNNVDKRRTERFVPKGLDTLTILRKPVMVFGGPETVIVRPVSAVDELCILPGSQLGDVDQRAWDGDHDVFDVVLWNGQNRKVVQVRRTGTGGPDSTIVFGELLPRVR